MGDERWLSMFECVFSCFVFIVAFSIWKKGDLRKGGDRTRWLNSPNVYQRVEVLETGTPDPKKITKVEIIKFENLPVE